MSDVVYLVPDLLFSSKIRETAAQLGLEATRARDPETFATAARTAKLVVIDLRAPVAMRALDLLAADPEAHRARSVGFVDHERADVMREASERGCSLVLAKGAFAAALPEILRTS